MMELPEIYKLIQRNKEIQNILEWPFDLTLISPTTETKQYFFKTTKQVICVAEDASGGVFALCGDEEVNEKAVMYVSSEGQVGKIADNFKCFITLIVSCPYWRDILKFSGNGQISEMKKALPILIKEYESDISELEELKERVCTLLRINKINDPVDVLYNAVKSQPNIIFTSNEGEEFDGLFNSFVVSDNPLWR